MKTESVIKKILPYVFIAALMTSTTQSSELKRHKSMIEEINWNRMWIEATENASWRKRRGDMTEFWNKRARRYSESLKHNDRSMQMISKLDTDPECTVLDIGAGPGTLTIPLAKIVKHVTVVEPSSEMLACLKKNAADEGLTNITCMYVFSPPPHITTHHTVLPDRSKTHLRPQNFYIITVIVF